MKLLLHPARFIRLAAVAPLLVGQAAKPMSPGPTRVDYTLSIDSSDLSGVAVEMRIRGAPAGFQVAMETHPEYDDQYWRYLTGLSGTSTGGTVRIVREDSAVWRVTAPAGDVTIRYRVSYPTSAPMQQPAWKAHLTPEGGLVGGPHSFFYVVGGERAPVHVTVTLPQRWSIATGLTRGRSDHEFTAPGAEALLDSPLLVGHIVTWPFAINGVPHRITYLGHPGGVPFDSTRLASSVERIARATVAMFGSMPYREFQFQFEDGAQGGLEHLNTITIGVPSAQLARDPDSPLSQIAHEYFHVWNEVHLRPQAWIGIRHVPPAPTGELWWSEGVTLYYADLLMRRAGLHTNDSTRMSRLERQMAMYRANPSHAAVSPEATSRAFNQPQGGLGDYTPSMYTQGELLGVVLDLMIREGSGDKRTLDDAMRAMVSEFTPERGFTAADVERAVSMECSCDAKAFFDQQVRTAGAIDFDHWLGVLGWRVRGSWDVARASGGDAQPDLRVSGYMVPGENRPRILVLFPATAWGKAGLHTGDRLVSWNGRELRDVGELRNAIGRTGLDETVRLVVMRDGRESNVNVTAGRFERPVMGIEEREDATAAQRAMRVRWLAGR
jgi:predicted metalloprotease with PDZ domain